MEKPQIDYDGLKKIGFLKARQEGFFVLRTRMPSGNYTPEALEKLADIARRYGKGILHATTRQGIEIPHIRYEDIVVVGNEIKAAGIETGTSGPRLRATTACPGTSWCKQGLINTFALFDRIENEGGMRCAMDLPHKFKMVISGCPNGCTRPQHSEIGIHGQVDVADPAKKIKCAVYIGGCGGRTPRGGFKLARLYAEDEVIPLVQKVVAFYKAHVQTRQRLAFFIEKIGRDAFLRAIGEK